MEAVVIVLVAVIAIAAIVIGVMQAAQRRKELTAWAVKMGFAFRAGKERGFHRRYPAFKMLNQGNSNRYADNFMSGRYADRDVLCFDCHYTINHGKSSSSHTFSAAILEPGHALRPLLIRRENAMDKVGEFFGMDDIDFESAEFSRTFFVKGDDRRWAYDVIHPATMEYLLSRPPYTLQMDDRRMIVTNERTWSPAQFADALDYAARFLDLIPPGVIEELRHAR